MKIYTKEEAELVQTVYWGIKEPVISVAMIVFATGFIGFLVFTLLFRWKRGQKYGLSLAGIGFFTAFTAHYFSLWIMRTVVFVYRWWWVFLILFIFLAVIVWRNRKEIFLFLEEWRLRRMAAREKRIAAMAKKNRVRSFFDF